ncbi:pectinesterase QRT1 [Syzygium oleosum]|uniref:pectinesterase QRT1 n=1 Tax=Syzygium oleosum TaxID=219896 RepID=UPI0024B8D700|nr:pectinesterase QRT1 [Syzygium oleosum]
MTMDLTSALLGVVMILSVLSEVDVMCIMAQKDFISWDDMRVNEHEYRNMIREESYSKKGQSNRSGVILVDKNGRGDSITVQGAVNMVPDNNSQRVKILILAGTYREKVHVPSSKPYISFIGDEDQNSKTRITWHDKASDKQADGCELGTYRSASVTVESDFFCASGITFENTVVAVPGGYGMQAVALRVSGDKAMFYRVRVLGTQDTLLDDTGSHYFYQCYIQGSVDFIFGRSTSLYEECVIHSTATNFGAIAAHHRDSPSDDSGFSFVNCVINGTGNIYLGRAWGDYSRAVYSYCYMDNIITPPGWSDWNHPYRQKTVVFGEYQCRGRGADKSGRVPWSKTFSHEEARPFLDKKFIQGERWLRL